MRVGNDERAILLRLSAFCVAAKMARYQGNLQLFPVGNKAMYSIDAGSSWAAQQAGIVGRLVTHSIHDMYGMHAILRVCQEFASLRVQFVV